MARHNGWDMNNAFGDYYGNNEIQRIMMERENAMRNEKMARKMIGLANNQGFQQAPQVPKEVEAKQDVKLLLLEE